MNSTERTIMIIKIEVLKEAVEALAELESERAKVSSVSSQRSRFGIKDSIQQLNEIIDACQSRME
jgi:hypothetical protein